jgi:hypothetical protein
MDVLTRISPPNFPGKTLLYQAMGVEEKWKNN